MLELLRGSLTRAITTVAGPQSLTGGSAQQLKSLDQHIVNIVMLNYVKLYEQANSQNSERKQTLKLT